MFKVTNNMKDVRKFRNGNTGRTVLVQPGESVLTDRPPEQNSVWKIEQVSEKKIKNKNNKSMEVDKK